MHPPIAAKKSKISVISRHCPNPSGSRGSDDQIRQGLVTLRQPCKASAPTQVEDLQSYAASDACQKKVENQCHVSPLPKPFGQSGSDDQIRQVYITLRQRCQILAAPEPEDLQSFAPTNLCKRSSNQCHFSPLPESFGQQGSDNQIRQVRST